MSDAERKYDRKKRDFEWKLGDALNLLDEYRGDISVDDEIAEEYAKLKEQVRLLLYSDDLALTKQYCNMKDNEFYILELRDLFSELETTQEEDEESHESAESIIEALRELQSELSGRTALLINEYKNLIDSYEKSYRPQTTVKVSSKIKDVAELDRPPSGNIIGKESAAPGILDDYRHWGIKRICLDGFQNHLSADAKGEVCYLHFLVDGNWLTRDEVASRHLKDKVTAIRFADDGVGFTPDNLKYLHSTKGSEDLSAGQFGEGLKLLSMAAVNYGLDLELWSRNWRARAIGVDTQIVNSRNNDEIEQRKKLVYEIEEYDGEGIIGSRTIFNKVTPEFVEYAMRLPELVLELGGIKPLATDNYRSELVDTEDGGLFYAKGIYVQDVDAVFSYNLLKRDLNPDRDRFTAGSRELADDISNCWSEVEDIEIIKKLLREVINIYQEGSEFRYKLEANPNLPVGIRWNLSNKNKELWKEAFIGVVKEKQEKDGFTQPKEPILETCSEIKPEVVEALKNEYYFVELPEEWMLLLAECGIKKDLNVIPEVITQVIETSLTLDYGASIWNAQRILLDACQNHLPGDSGGSHIMIRFMDEGSNWHDISEIGRFEDSQILSIKISDDGRGYDFKGLGLFESTKGKDSAGKWGEGLKMLSSAVLRTGALLKLKSRDWCAISEKKTEVLDEGLPNEKKVQRLVFRVKTNTRKDKDIFYDGDYLAGNEQSSTTIVAPTPDIIREFRNIQENVLFINPPRPITSTRGIDVIGTSGGKLYVKELLVPGDHRIKYSYHLRNHDIETRDRDAITADSMQKCIMTLLEETKSEDFISRFLDDCVLDARSGGQYLEFNTRFRIYPHSEEADRWIKVFKEKFGEKTAVRDVRSQDMSEMHRAHHVGLGVVTLPSTVASVLSELEGTDGQKISSYKSSLDEAIKNAVPVNESDLTKEELEIISTLAKYNKVLRMHDNYHPVKHIKVYDYEKDYTGTRALGYANYGDTVHISREALRGGIVKAGDVFFHESAHAETGAEDPDPEFRNYLSSLLSHAAPSVLTQSVDDGNGLVEDVGYEEIVALRSALSIGAENSPFKNMAETIAMIEKINSSGITLDRLKKAIEKEMNQGGGDER